MHRLWKDYLVGRSPLWWRSSDLIVPIGETLPDVSIIPAERSHGKSWSGARGIFATAGLCASLPPRPSS
jgi:hypothetical protein